MSNTPSPGLDMYGNPPAGPANAGKQNLPGFRTTPTKPFRRTQTPDVVLLPRTHRALQEGVDLIAEAVRPTLGPLPRLVVSERTRRDESPEFLDDGATIARRIIQIAPRDADVGAMLLRQALWRMKEEVGDGSSTMAVMCQSLIDTGLYYLTTTGVNAMLLRSRLEKGLRTMLEALRQQALPLSGREAIAGYARGLVQGNEELALLLGEVFDIVGGDGLISVEKGNRWGLEREYVEGTYWHLSGFSSRLFVTDQARQQTVFDDAAILSTDRKFTDPQQLIPVLEQCVKNGVKRLVIVAAEIADSVIGLLLKNNQAGTIQTLVVRAPRVAEEDHVAAAEDIAMLTGGRAFLTAGFADLRDFRIADLGHARRAWATESQFGLAGGQGDPRQVRQHMLKIRGQLKVTEDAHAKRMLQERLGRMAGATAILRVGGATDSESDALETTAQRAVTSLRKALAGGVVPGGGAALLHAAEALDAQPAADEVEAIAYRMLSRALEEPMRTIAENAGYQPDIIVEKLKEAPQGHGLDARSGQIVEMASIGVLDSLLVLERALETAVSCAVLTLTTDVIVHRKRLQESIEP